MIGSPSTVTAPVVRQCACGGEDEAAFAGAVGAEQRGDAPGRDHQIDPMDDLAAAAHHPQVGDGKPLAHAASPR